MANENGNIEITQEQAQQISMILNELPIRELGKVQAIISIFNGEQGEQVAEDAVENDDD